MVTPYIFRIAVSYRRYRPLSNHPNRDAGNHGLLSLYEDGFCIIHMKSTYILSSPQGTILWVTALAGLFHNLPV